MILFISENNRTPSRNCFILLQMADPVGRRKENIVDLNKYLDKRIRVKFNGGRECSGVLKGRIEVFRIIRLLLLLLFRLSRL